MAASKTSRSSRPRPARAGSQPAARPVEPAGKKRLYLHRAVAVIEPDHLEIRPALGAAVAPLVMFLVGAAAFVVVLLSALGGNFPLWVVLPALLVALILVPLAGMGFVYSVVGASVVIDRAKSSATWQQGMLGLGVGTRELVPFHKIAGLAIEEVVRADASPNERRVDPVSQFDLVLVKQSGRRLTIGTVSVVRPLRREAYERLREVGQAVARITGANLTLPGKV